MEMGGGVFEVNSTAGETQLGGTDMDNLLANHVAEEFTNVLV
jgi:molecular chaperone DnaK